MLSNPRSERVKAVRRLSGRSARQREGRFVAEGPQAVREAVAAHRDALVGEGVVQALYATAAAIERYGDILAVAASAGLDAVEVTDEVLAAMADTVTPQGLIAVCRTLDVPLDVALAGGPKLVAVLAHVRDPGNAGTVIRAADAAGADVVVLTDASVDVHNPKSVRATAGSLFHLPVVTGVPLAELVTRLHEAGVQVLAADGVADWDLDTLADAADAARLTGAGPPPGTPRLAEPVAWVFGNEAWGLPEADRALADAVVSVPIHGRAESLNLATAATVCLYATARAQRPGPDAPASETPVRTVPGE